MEEEEGDKCSFIIVGLNPSQISVEHSNHTGCIVMKYFTKLLKCFNLADRCSSEELDDLRLECNELVIRKMNIESEIESYKEQVSSQGPL